MGTRMPRLAEVSCTKHRFLPGDRVIVNVFHHLTNDETKRLRRTVQKWCGKDVEVLVVDNTVAEVIVEHNYENRRLIGK